MENNNNDDAGPPPVLTWKESHAVESSGWEAGFEVWVPSLKPG